MSMERQGKPSKEGDFQIFTDGSREENMSGASCVVIEMPEEKVLYEKIVHLGDTTVAQCETYAIGMATDLILRTPEMFRGKTEIS